jgi:hypothetical protein
MPRNQPIHYSLLANTAKVCAMSGCEKPRHKLAKHCRMHDKRRRRWKGNTGEFETSLRSPAR